MLKPTRLSSMILACLVLLTLAALVVATAACAAPREASRLRHDKALLPDASNQLAARTILTVPYTSSVDGATLYYHECLPSG